MKLLRIFRRHVTPPEKKHEVEVSDKELMDRLRRQLAAERRVALSGK